MMTLERRSFLAALGAGLSGISLPAHAFADSTRPGVKVAADEDRFGEPRAIGFNSTTFKLATADTQGALFMMEQHSKKPEGPPLHLHHQQDEFWYVISGGIRVSSRFRALPRPTGCSGHARFLMPTRSSVRCPEAESLLGSLQLAKSRIISSGPGRRESNVADAALYRAYGVELLGAPLSLK
jgi:hypothetical protein